MLAGLFVVGENLCGLSCLIWSRYRVLYGVDKAALRLGVLFVLRKLPKIPKPRIIPKISKTDAINGGFLDVDLAITGSLDFRFGKQSSVASKFGLQRIWGGLAHGLTGQIRTAAPQRSVSAH